MERRAVLVFCRPYLLADFRANIAPLADEYDFHLLTDGRCSGTRDTRARFYSRLGQSPAPSGFTSADEGEVIARCRYLRNLEPKLALSMLRAMASVIEEEMDRVRPAVVLSHMVDEYVTNLTAEIAKRRGVPYVGYAYSYFPGKIQATLYSNGEPHRLREPADDEVRQTLEQISLRTFRQDYAQPDTYTPLRHLKAMLRYRVKQVVFAIKKRLDRDRLNIHYGCLPFVVERRHWRDFPAASDFHSDWKQRIESAGGERPIVYMPLGYFPEATIDYWIEDRRILDYEAQVLKICELLGRHFRVVVKEHLHMLGGRSPVFYRKLRDIPGVVSAHPQTFSNDVLGMADVVLMGAGSVGVEAFIRGKPIVSFSHRSYWFAASGASYVDLADLDSWPAKIGACLAAYSQPSARQRFEFVRECLRSTMRTQRPGRRWPICVPEDLRQALESRARVARTTDIPVKVGI
jgi:hypothetical protein